MKNPKIKGGKFERSECRRLSLWLSDGKREDLFWRSSMSGGRATVAKAKGITLEAQAGDITAIHPEGHEFTKRFYVECKHYKDLCYHGIITNTGPLMEFWASTVTEANCYGKHPLLIAKQNYLPTIACLNQAGLRILGISESCADIGCWKRGLFIYTFDYFLLSKPGW